ncbi:MAG: GNAT family N-acetyltransferase [Dysgonomonas sp.]
MKVYKLILKPVANSDISLLSKWLHKDYILKWYHDAEEWLNEIEERHGKFRFLSHYLVLDDNNVPFGFCQFYDCFDAKEDWYSVASANEMYSIDYLIGKEEYLGKGYGKEIVKVLVNKILEVKNTEAIVVQPEQNNIASCKALLANNFIYDVEKGYYIRSFF